MYGNILKRKQKWLTKKYEIEVNTTRIRFYASPAYRRPFITFQTLSYTLCHLTLKTLEESVFHHSSTEYLAELNLKADSLSTLN